jgi:DNA-binding response OmpR family regulator
MAKILLVEDEPEMQRGLKDNLEFEGYKIVATADGKEALRLIGSSTYDLILLDVMLPGMSGFDICKKAREKGIRTPIIMLTAKGEEVDRVLGLELGADDYITKPFSLRELLARVKAVLRRAGTGKAQLDSKIIMGGVAIDFNSYTAVKGKKTIDMTPKEFELLKYLWQHKNQVVSRDDLLTTIWGYDEAISSRTVDNFILKLRQKLEIKPAKPKLIVTMHGTGYKLIDSNE